MNTVIDRSGSRLRPTLASVLAASLLWTAALTPARADESSPIESPTPDPATEVSYAESVPEAIAGSISGRAESLDGVGLPQVTVTSFRYLPMTNEWEQMESRTTGENGAFTLPDLPAGRYTLQYMPYLNNGYLTTWWGGSLHQDSADGFELGPGEELPGMNLQLVLGAVIKGTVTDAEGVAISGARLAFADYGTDGGGRAFVNAISAEDGSFRLQGIPPAQFRVEIKAPFDSGYVGEWWENAIDSSTADVVAIELGTTTELDVQLERAASISGKVSDYTGRGIDKVSVQAWAYRESLDDWTPTASGTTRSDGSYDLYGLRPGTYTLTFHPSWNSPFLGQWWGGADELESASSFTLEAGEEQSNRDVKLMRNFEVGAAAIIGTAVVGETLFPVVLTVEGGGATHAYQWLRDGVIVPGATDRSYQVTAADVGSRISLRATLRQPGYITREVTTSATDPVTMGALVMVTPSSLSGTAEVGSIQQVRLGAWNPTPTQVAYQWRRDGIAIPGANQPNYTMAVADAGHAIDVEVVASRPGYLTMTEALASPAVCLPKKLAPAPTFAGMQAVGSILTGEPGVWPAGTKVTYQWRANAVPLRSETGLTLKIGKALRDKKLGFYVSGVVAGCRPVVVQSMQAAKTATAATPKISGKAKTGSTLKVKRGTWTGKTTFSYRWYADGKPIPKATKSKLKLSTSLKGKKITVMVTGKRPGYATVTKTSAATRPVR